MRRKKIIRESGPYWVDSLADGKILVAPSWPQFPPYTEQDGGGPGILIRMSLAAALQEWLNEPYQKER